MAPSTSPSPPEVPDPGTQPPTPRAAVTADQVAEAEVWLHQHLTSWGRYHRLQPSDLDDARQDAELALIRAAAHFNPARAPGQIAPTWRRYAQVAVARALLNFLRTRGRAAGHYAKGVSVADLSEDAIPPSGHAHPLTDPAEGPEELAAQHDDESRLAVAVSALSDAERQLYAMKRAGLRQVEIAHQLGVSVDVVRGRLDRLMARLRAALGVGRD